MPEFRIEYGVTGSAMGFEHIEAEDYDAAVKKLYEQFDADQVGYFGDNDPEYHLDVEFVEEV